MLTPPQSTPNPPNPTEKAEAAEQGKLKSRSPAMSRPNNTLNPPPCRLNTGSFLSLFTEPIEPTKVLLVWLSSHCSSSITCHVTMLQIGPCIIPVLKIKAPPAVAQPNPHSQRRNITFSPLLPGYRIPNNSSLVPTSTSSLSTITECFASISQPRILRSLRTYPQLSPPHRTVITSPDSSILTAR